MEKIAKFHLDPVKTPGTIHAGNLTEESAVVVSEDTNTNYYNSRLPIRLLVALRRRPAKTIPILNTNRHSPGSSRVAKETRSYRRVKSMCTLPNGNLLLVTIGDCLREGLRWQKTQ